MAITGLENWEAKFYWIPVLVIVLVFGLVAYLAGKKPERMRRRREKKREDKNG